MKLLKSLLVLAGLLTLAASVGCNGARNTAIQSISTAQPTGFLVKQVQTGGRIRSYGLFIPRAYTPQRPWPVIVFLHGIGEAGSDPRSAMRVGLAPIVADQQATFPFIVVFPQSTGGWGENSQAAEDVINILHQVKRDYSVDNSSISLTGLSTGGYGTFAIGAKYPNEFTALAPMCPSGAFTKDGATLARMNIWAFENAADPFVAPLSMVTTLSSIRNNGGSPRHTVFVGVGHNCWDKAYNDGEVFEWMKSQRRTGDSAVASMSTYQTPPTQRATAYAPPAAAPAQQKSRTSAKSRPVTSPPRTVTNFIPSPTTPAYAPPVYSPPAYQAPAYAPARSSLPVPMHADNDALVPTPY